MLEWQKQIQYVVNVIDESIKAHQDEFLTLNALADQLAIPSFIQRENLRQYREWCFGIICAGGNWPLL